MNPLNNDDDNDDNEINEKISNNNNKIFIRFQQNGRKKNSYVTGWMLDISDQKKHLKILKNKLACSGSCKVKNIDGESKIVLHLQGDHVDFLKKYLIDNGVDGNNIDKKCHE
jgi:translation initiation factor 1 (eIF-1/SUI1)